ncbi:hypothetical protein BKA70DRAFT_1235404 [Coprinopsis sp. MPI-PUGE-AT-0042]|nr:hypothetical protein BKA70DRAFT_1235404 [Coprinopsis sp. MPI-PUGE-AT-0042]
MPIILELGNMQDKPSSRARRRSYDQVPDMDQETALRAATERGAMNDLALREPSAKVDTGEGWIESRRERSKGRSSPALIQIRRLGRLLCGLFRLLLAVPMVPRSMRLANASARASASRKPRDIHAETKLQSRKYKARRTARTNVRLSVDMSRLDLGNSQQPRKKGIEIPTYHAPELLLIINPMASGAKRLDRVERERGRGSGAIAKIAIS